MSIHFPRSRASVVVLSLLASSLGAGCLSRPVGSADPTTKVAITSDLAGKKIDKIDLLLAIDNSQSMGDKQRYLAKAVPDLVNALVTPACVDASGNPTGQVADISRPSGSQCPDGSAPAFEPVTDIHVALVSSSLGAFGDSICDESASARENDHGHLITVDQKGNPDAPDAPAGFLSWSPAAAESAHEPPPVGAIAQPSNFQSDFQKLVEGNGQTGCGLEAQLESMYRFLVQPDPWQKVATDDAGVAHYQGVDETIIQQRHDFLRPDSLVAVVMLTDEDDSFSDPLSQGGKGWWFSRTNGTGSGNARVGAYGSTMPRPTAACATDPNAAACKSCWDVSMTDQDRAADASCSQTGGYYAGDEDYMDVRFFHMKERFGMDPQYPTSRYVNGLSRAKVPAGSEEHDAFGRYLPDAGTCANPLFASALPADLAAARAAAPTVDAAGKPLSDEARTAYGLCHLPAGARKSDLVFFATIGGVPNQLLHFDPTNPTASRIGQDDWKKILGADPEHHDTTGISPYMVQSITPRAALAVARPLARAASPELGDNGTNPINGREWDTKGMDLQYACTFPLEADSDTNVDCGSGSDSPLCEKAADGTVKQTRAKAYPTIRELSVVRGLGEQGIVASICPRTVDLAGKTLEPETKDGAPNPLYGYRPAVSAIVSRLSDRLKLQCLPDQLARDDKNEVSCLVLATLDGSGSEADCAAQGLEIPDASVLSNFRRDHANESVGRPGAAVCVLPQTGVTKGESCTSSADATWCYVEAEGDNRPAGTCAQALQISSGAKGALKNAIYTLQCIEQS